MITYKTYIENSEPAFAKQINLFCINIKDYIKLLDLDQDKVDKFRTTNNYVQFIFNANKQAQIYAMAFTSYKDQLHDGPSEELMGLIPPLPVYPTVMPSVSFGNARTQFSELIQDCIKSKSFTKTIGIFLHFLKDDTVENAEEVTPVLKVKFTTGGHPELHVAKGIYQGYEVWKDIGDGGGYKKTDTSLSAKYTDLSKLPTIGKGQSWKYKVIYILKGVHCGNWSNEAVIGVFGWI